MPSVTCLSRGCVHARGLFHVSLRLLYLYLLLLFFFFYLFSNATVLRVRSFLRHGVYYKSTPSSANIHFFSFPFWKKPIMKKNKKRIKNKQPRPVTTWLYRLKCFDCSIMIFFLWLNSFSCFPFFFENHADSSAVTLARESLSWCWRAAIFVFVLLFFKSIPLSFWLYKGMFYQVPKARCVLFSSSS